MSHMNRLEKVESIKQKFLTQTDIVIRDCVEFIKMHDNYFECMEELRLHADIMHYLYLLKDYLKSDWAFMQYEFMSEDNGYTVYDISDEMIDYIYLDHISALDILDAMIYKRPWYGPISDRFIDIYVLTTMHRLASDAMKREKTK